MLKVATVSPNEPYREYKDVERVYSGSTEIDKILDKNGNVLFAVNKEVEGTPALTYKGKEETNLKNYRIYGNTETKTRSYSGSAPLNFPIVDGSVSNYRIHGNTENGESVGGLVTDSQSEHYGKYAIPITNNSETSNIYLDEPLRKVGDEAEYVDYAEQKWHRVRKNLLQNTATSQTINGVTFTVNEDGSVTCNGTASDTAECRLAYNFLLPAGNYCLTGIPPSGSASSYYLRAWYNSSGSIVWINNYGNGCNFTLTDTTKMLSSIVVWSGKVLDNITFYPMIRKADIEDDTYEPYIENTEVDVTVPALPSQSSTNSLSVGTAAQPSSVAVDVDEVVSCGDRTGNLFDYTKTNRQIHKLRNDDGTINTQNTQSNYFEYYIPVKPNTTYTVKTSTNCPSRIYFFDSQKQWLSRSGIIEASSMLNYRTFTIPNNCYFIQFQEFDDYRMDETTIILVEGSEVPASYEPYGYKVPVTVEGKNLCNNIWEQGGIDGNTGNVVSSPSIVCCDFIPVKPDVTYSCSRTIANNFINLRCYGANKNYLGTGTDLANKGNPLIQGAPFGTFMITDARVSYIRFNDYSNALDTKYMLVEGVYTAETMPPYEPYHAPITTPVYLPEPIKMVGSEAEYIDYGEQKLHRVRKNLANNKHTRSHVNYTITENDNYIHVVGTNTTSVTQGIILSNFVDLEAGEYDLVNNSSAIINVDYYDENGIAKHFNVPSNSIKTFTYPSNVTRALNVYKGILAGTSIDAYFQVMIVKHGNDTTIYEPYIKNTELDVTLPALPTLSGTNTLSVGTEVQPSNVYLKGRIKEIT